MVEVKFKFLQNISHYYHNRFAFHMHMFIIFILSLNKLNTTIHSNIRFLVIAYNQNLHFGIHCKKLQKQDYNSFHHNLIEDYDVDVRNIDNSVVDIRNNVVDKCCKQSKDIGRFEMC
jgi:hypothetical protein